MSHAKVEENLHYLIPFLYHTLPSMVLTFKVLSPCPRLVAKSDFFFFKFFFHQGQVLNIRKKKIKSISYKLIIYMHT